MEFQSNRATTHGVNDFNARNLNFNDELQKIGDWKFITVGNLNKFTSYLLRPFKVIPNLLASPITFVCARLLSFDFVRVIFDRGREFEDIRRYPCYVGGNSEIVYELVLQQGCKLDLRFTNSIVYVLIRGEDSCYARYLFVKYYDRLYLDAFCYVTVLSWFILMHNYKANVDYKMIIFLGYELELLFADLNGSLNVKEDDNGDTIRLLDKILQQVIIMWIISTLQKTRERKLGNAQDTFEQLLVKDFRLLTYMKVYWKGFEVIEIAATSCKLFILIVFRPLVFLPNFDLTWILFDSWSMENGCGYILVSVGLLAYRSSIVCINKGLDSSYDETHLLQLKSGLY